MRTDISLALVRPIPPSTVPCEAQFDKLNEITICGESPEKDYPLGKIFVEDGVIHVELDDPEVQVVVSKKKTVVI